MLGLNYNSFELGLLTLLVAFCIFTLVNRICSCIETCAKAKAVGKLNEAGLNIKAKDVEDYINGQTNKNS